MKQIATLATLIALIAGFAAVSASAQQVVVLTGDTGVTTALEVKAPSGFVVRGGAMHHTDHSDEGAYELGWVLSAGYRFESENRPVTLDLAYDAEKMQPHLADLEGAVDSRARAGVGYKVTKHSALVAEFSRSLHNGTDYDRLMVGVRFGF